ncbi:MAG TPA: TonB-dependent receptor [Steroidobacteraceae bacterium]|nr:TonB-dependent receptor [Steroidobacteraceae bacterium]
MHPSEKPAIAPESNIGAAVKYALLSGATAAIGAALPAPATAQTAGGTTAASDEMTEIVITGTRIRRVDTETASPILTINQTAIEASGLQTVGELVAELPTVSGAAVNPAVNNGGGFGEANVELRGLNAVRTLVLLNGRRIGLIGASGAVDVNQIPINMIDHVEVLKEGAGAIYGSDAIAGVVNFITKTHAEGLELSGETGQTSRSDGKHLSLSGLFGNSSEKMDITIGGSYTRQDPVSAGDREYSRLARYLYSGLYGPAGYTPTSPQRYEFDAGSSRIPTGRESIAHASAAIKAFYGCTTIMRIPGAAGSALADYRCYHNSDAFNYQPYNLLITPQERGAVFSTVNYKVTDAVEIYAEMLMNRTHSGFQIAPLPYDATSDDVIVSKDSMYNPFGIDFGGDNTGNGNFRLRLSSLGTRHSQTTSDSKLLTTGIKGKLFDTGWQWDANMSYGRLDQSADTDGYIYFPDLAKAVGPSFVNPATGAPTCGTPSSVDPATGYVIPAVIVPNCTPINIFNTDLPATISALRQMSTDFKTDNTFITKAATFNLNGKVVAMPAGDMQAAVGVEYRKLSTIFEADHLVIAQPPLFIKCIISQEACTGPSSGRYDDKEVYAELFVPLLKDMPGAKALNLDAGVRYSSYSLFGNTTKAQLKIEYRPVSDLLVRGTYSQVFRVPTLGDLYTAPAISNPTFNDPCYGLTAAAAAANPNLAADCVGVLGNGKPDGSYAYNGTAQITAVLLSNPNLKPETGNVVTYGFVLQVPGVQNLSVSVDMWRYELNNLITALDPNYVSDQCLASGNPDFCGLITRYTFGVNQGEVRAFQLPTVNLGQLKEDGTDFGVKYQLKNTRAGNFNFSLDATYINSYLNTPFPGAASQEIAGTFDTQFGNYARWRGLGSVGWALGDFDAMLSSRYIHHLVVHNAATQSAAVKAGGFPNPDLKIPSITYFDLTFGYSIKSTKTKLQIGVQNLTDKQPSVFYQNNVINADTDVSTYDTLGRRYFVTFNQKF